MATGKAYATATMHGLEHSKEFHFLAGPKHPYLGLPADEIAGLGLSRLQNRRITFRTADGPIASDAYIARGTIQGMGFVATVVAAPVPVAGLQFLENHGFIVNPETNQVELDPGFIHYLPSLIPVTADDDI